MKIYDSFIFFIGCLFVSASVGCIFTKAYGFLLFGVLMILLSIIHSEDLK